MPSFLLCHYAVSDLHARNDDDNDLQHAETRQDMDGWSSVLRPCQHSIGYMGDGFYRSKDPTNSIKVLKGDIH